MRVLVCGGRHFDDVSLMADTLDKLSLEKPIAEIIHGGAPGADHLAGCWADYWNVPQRQFKADWNRYGRSAGPRRNRQMLEEGKPDLVVAFPGGRGTADMVMRAKAAGVEVMQVPA